MSSGASRATKSSVMKTNDKSEAEKKEKELDSAFRTLFFSFYREGWNLEDFDLSLLALWKTPCPRLDSPINSPWCHPPGVPWLMRSGCHPCVRWRQGSRTRRLRWKRGWIFPKIETSEREQSPASGWSEMRPACRTENVPAPRRQSVLMLQRRSRAETGGDGLALGSTETQ